MTSKEIYNLLPSIIKSILINLEGWLVGSSIESTYKKQIVSDYDIIIEDPKTYQRVIKFLSEVYPKYELNSWGGIKFNINYMEVDIWCENMGHFIQNASSFTFALSIKGQKLIRLND